MPFLQFTGLVDPLRPGKWLQNLDLTGSLPMERLPTETMAEILEHLDGSTIRSFTIVSSKYCAIARPIIFRRICVDQKPYEHFVLFVEKMEESNKLALMIKILIIHGRTVVKLLPRLFAVVSNLEELHLLFGVDEPFLSPHYFPDLRRLRFQVSKNRILEDLVANFIPRHERLNSLEVISIPDTFNGVPNVVLLDVLLLAESASSWVDRLVTYHGPRSLLHLLTPNSKMKHLTSSQQLDEVTLHELSRAVSGRLLTLIIDDPTDLTAEQSLPASLLPSLFPNLRSIAWLSIYIINPGSLDNQIADTDQNALTLSAIDQLPHLRRIWFSSKHSRGAPEGVTAFITEIQELSGKRHRSLLAIYVYASVGHPFSLIYSRTSIQSQWVLSRKLPVVPFVD